MKMFWNRSLSRAWGNAAVLHLLRAATIAVVASSCSTSPPKVVPAQAEGPLTPPLVLLLAPDSDLAAEIKHYAWTAYEALESKGPYQDLLRDENQLETVVDVTITYKDSKGEERLLSLAPTVPNPNNGWTANFATFRIPTGPGPGDFKPANPNDSFLEAKATETSSPQTTTYCNRNSAGTAYSCF